MTQAPSRRYFLTPTRTTSIHIVVGLIGGLLAVFSFGYLALIGRASWLPVVVALLAVAAAGRAWRRYLRIV